MKYVVERDGSERKRGEREGREGRERGREREGGRERGREMYELESWTKRVK